MFVPLHVKSDYSLGFGTAPVDALAARAAELGYAALALTDIENLYGQVRFHAQCRARGLRPLTGLELRPHFQAGRTPGGRKGRLVLLAAEDSGYANLCRIVTLRRGAPPHKTPGEAHMDEPAAVLSGRTAGLFALSDDHTLVARLLAAGLFEPRRMGLLLIRPGPAMPAAQLRTAAHHLGVPLVADLDALLLDAQDHGLHLLQLAVHQGRSVAQTVTDPALETPQRLLRTPQEAAALFADLPHTIAAARRIAEACRLELGAGPLSVSSLPDHPAAGAALRRHCAGALARRRTENGVWSRRHADRLAQELDLFEKLGFYSSAWAMARCRRKIFPDSPRKSNASIPPGTRSFAGTHHRRAV